MAKAPLTDATARGRAATDMNSNLVVLAGAGTGKTSLLIERILNAIGTGILALDQMAAVTFTDKASAEMRERLGSGLESLYAVTRGDAPPDSGSEAGRAWAYLSQHHETSDIKQRIVDALDSLETAQITTIHGFCSEILRSHPREAGVDPDFIIDKGEHGQRLFEERWRRFLGEQLQSDHSANRKWTGLLDRLSLKDITSIARVLASFSMDEDSGAQTGGSQQGFLRDLATRPADAIDTLLKGQPEFTAKTREYSGRVALLLRAYVDEGAAGLNSVIGTDREAFETLMGRSITPGVKVTDQESEAIQEAFKSGKRVLKALGKIDNDTVATLTELLHSFGVQFRQAMLRSGYVTFDGLLRLTRDLLRQYPAIRDNYKRRYRMLLVDEFQDTDPLQYEIVFYLTGVVGSTERDAYAEDLTAGRLFIVGDSKQSIYRFRGADFDAFRRAVLHIESCGGQTLDLISNFRSDAAILAGINDLLDSPLSGWNADSRQPDYVRLGATREGSEERPIEIWTLAGAAGKHADERRAIEGQILAQGIQETVQDGTFGYEDCIVILRAMTSLPLYVRPLRAAGIPFVVDGGKQFLERAEVVQFLSVLRTVACPGDQAALVAYLRSPGGGVDDTELTRFADGGGRWVWSAQHPDPKQYPTLARRFEELRTLSREMSDLTPGLAIHHALESSRLLILHGAGFEGPQRVANLRKVATTVADRVADGRFDLAEILDAIHAGRIGDLDTEAPLSDDATSGVRIMTVHKVKGLEGSVVFVPDLARESMDNRAPSWNARVVSGGDESSHAAVRGTTICNENAAAQELLDIEHGRAEGLRVLYVALTRAAHRLVIMNPPGKAKNDWQRALAAWGYDVESPPTNDGTLDHPAVRHRSVTGGDVEPQVTRDDTPLDSGSVDRWEQAAKLIRDSSTCGFHAPSDHDAPETIAPMGDGPHEANDSSDVGRALGTTLHLALETWDLNDASLLACARRIAETQAVAYAVDPTSLVSSAEALVSAFLSSDLAGRLRNAEIVGREVPLLLRDDDGRRWRGSIDLLYRDARDGHGGIVVADFKTDLDTDPDRLRDRYSKQLAVYARAVKMALQLPSLPPCEIWALRSGERVNAAAAD
ncbi:MAG: UvrD-helicase domain-containing protein [Acidobacteriota bacterium]|nr:UvrD-helicase domain-containing protein [Acidobacteriota bacterium]MDH3783752.1 UvrD-helicase domain-containing protein [Acidobacteriota bacterium]